MSKEFVGYAECRDDGKLFIGKIGIKVYRYKKDIRAEGFADENIMQVVVRRKRKDLKK